MHLLHSEVVAPLPQEQCLVLQALATAVAEHYPIGATLQVILTDDKQMRELNRTYRDKDYATDVLSFDLGQDMDPEVAVDAAIGEIYISLERAQDQAAAQGAALLTEIARLLVHGQLHLAGYEHDTDAELHFMESETDKYLERFELLENRTN